MGAIIVIGLGSMGKRRIRLLKEIDPRLKVYGVDSREDRRAEAQALGAECLTSLDGFRGSVSAACVCTPPLTHAGVIAECIERGWDVFTELNLVSDGYEENMAAAASKGLVLFLSSTFLYREEVRYIREATSDVAGAYRYHVGQYLPDWHPWESYHDFFVADARTSGIRELLAIELPWLASLYGEVESLAVERAKTSMLDIPYEDTLAVILKHEGGVVGSLLVDVVSRKPVRDFEFTSECCYLKWDGTPEGLEELDTETGDMAPVRFYDEGGAAHMDGYASFVIENAYRNELECFLGCVERSCTAPYGFADDIRTLALVDRIAGAL